MSDRLKNRTGEAPVSDRLKNRTVDEGEVDHLQAAWQLKERIHQGDGVLAQGRDFFVAQYRRSKNYVVLTEDTDEVVAFAIVRPDGYLSMLGVAPGHRRRGLGTKLVGRAAADYGRVTLHTRVTNHGAVGFYTDLGFVVDRRVENYYVDGTDAFLLALESGTTELVERLTELVQ